MRDDPDARLELIARTYHGPTGNAPRHLPYRRAALSFMRWQVARGVLNPLDALVPGSPWWRSMNECLLQDGCEAVLLSGEAPGAPSSAAVELWLQFVATPTARSWYRAHNASIVRGYLQHRDLAEDEVPAERFFMNVALGRVLYAHSLVAAPRLAVGRFALLAGGPGVLDRDEVRVRAGGALADQVQHLRSERGQAAGVGVGDASRPSRKLRIDVSGRR